MYVLYLDDSGSVFNKQEEYLVLGGVCVHEASIHWLSQQIEALAILLNPNDPKAVEFHAAAIFGGREGIWKQIADRNQRIETIKQVFNFFAPIEGYSEDEINYHIGMLYKAGFIEGNDATAMGDRYTSTLVNDLTWAGHEFLSATRDPSVWAKVKKSVLDKGGSFTVDLLLAAAKQIILGGWQFS